MQGNDLTDEAPVKVQSVGVWIKGSRTGVEVDRLLQIAEIGGRRNGKATLTHHRWGNGRVGCTRVCVGDEIEFR